VIFNLVQVAHRLELVMGCDTVIIMEEGQMVEAGAPAQLLRMQGSHFAALHRAATRL
jgi:ABC-type multidrug transport system fused ATPase/permease subunit